MLKTQILEEIINHNTIVIARHVSPDPDALGSQRGLRELLVNTFPEKDIFMSGKSVERLSYITRTDSIHDSDYADSLVIILDTANEPRIDDSRYKDASKLIKIDHHPGDDNYADICWVDPSFSSTSEMIYDFYLANQEKLIMTEEVAKYLYYGIVADTGRFLHNNTTPRTFNYASQLLETGIDITDLYNHLYARPFAEVKFKGYISNNLTVTDNGLAYVKVTSDVIKEYGVDAASPSNMIGDFNNINEVLVWIFVTEDVKQEQIRINIRSRGPVINTIAEQYNGGGHPLASGARLKSFEEADKLLTDLDIACGKYKETNV